MCLHMRILFLSKATPTERTRPTSKESMVTEKVPFRPKTRLSGPKRWLQDEKVSFQRIHHLLEFEYWPICDTFLLFSPLKKDEQQSNSNFERVVGAGDVVQKGLSQEIIVSTV
jgi:hypothetical protein